MRRAIIDEGLQVPVGVSIGVDPVQDVACRLAISPAGVTVVPKGHALSAEFHPVGRGHLAAAVS